MNASRFVIYYNKQIGQGTQGIVCKGYDNEKSQEICVKIISGSFNMDRELSILKELSKWEQKPNILNVYHIEQKINELDIFMEKCDYDLEQYMDHLKSMNKWFTAEQIIDFVIQISEGYNYLIQKKIIHRDLKPQNILVKMENGNPIYKLADFGVGKILDNFGELSHTRAGTPFYQAPEVLNKTGYDSRCDIYSFGLIIYQLVYDSNSHLEANTHFGIQTFNEKLKTTLFKCPENSKVPKELLELIEKMIVYDMNKRITWQSLFREPLLMNYEYVQDYTIISENQIGRGTQGSVSECFKGNDRTTKYAAKRLCRSKDVNRDKYVESELEITKKLSEENCENIVKIYDILIKDKFYFIIMEKCDYDLRSYLYKTQKVFEEPDILNFLYQIVSGYEKIQQHKIIHRDLKPENILVKINGKITYKLADFGIGVIKEKQNVMTYAGSPQYQAPEVGKGDYSDQCDVYSLGIIVYELMYRDVPSKIPENFFKSIQQNEFILPNNSRFKNNLKEIIQKMLIYDPKKRITWGGINKELKFFQQKNQPDPVHKPIKMVSNFIKLGPQQPQEEKKRVIIKYSTNQFQHQNSNKDISQDIPLNHTIVHSLSQSESPKKRISIKKEIEMTNTEKLYHLLDILHTKFWQAHSFYNSITRYLPQIINLDAPQHQVIKSTVIRYSAFLIMNALDLLLKFYDNMHRSLIQIFVDDGLFEALDFKNSQIDEIFQKIKVDNQVIQIIYTENQKEIQKMIDGQIFEDRDINQYLDYFKEQNLQYQQTDKQNFNQEWKYFSIFYNKYLRELLPIENITNLDYLKFVSQCEFFNTIEQDYPIENYKQFKPSYIQIEEKNIEIILNYLRIKRENVN